MSEEGRHGNAQAGRHHFERRAGTVQRRLRAATVSTQGDIALISTSVDVILIAGRHGILSSQITTAVYNTIPIAQAGLL